MTTVLYVCTWQLSLTSRDATTALNDTMWHLSGLKMDWVGSRWHTCVTRWRKYSSVRFPRILSRSVLLRSPLSSLSSRCLLEKNLDKGSWKRKVWLRSGNTRCNILPPWENLFPNCEGLTWVVKSWQIQYNSSVFLTTESCLISEYCHFCQTGNDNNEH